LRVISALRPAPESVEGEESVRGGENWSVAERGASERVKPALEKSDQERVSRLARRSWERVASVSEAREGRRESKWRWEYIKQWDRRDGCGGIRSRTSRSGGVPSKTRMKEEMIWNEKDKEGER
jgi:hypothetical protein